MLRAIRVAEKSRGLCSPNPFVGAIIVKNERIIAEGSTKAYGYDHAEVSALKMAGKAAKGAEMYVTLEPCSHYGKTPPCAHAIVKAGIQRVYIGIKDPNPLVCGKGIEILENNGIHTETGFFATKIEQQLEYYLCRILKQRPFVIWKAALSLDGKYAAQDGSSRWISNEASRKYVHKLRQEVDAVLTGVQTVLCDDPLLTVRLKHPKRQALRVVLDPLLQIPLDSKLVQTASEYPTALFYRADIAPDPKMESLVGHQVRLYKVAGSGNSLQLNEVLKTLHSSGIYSILLECGSTLSEAFFNEALVDKCLIFYGSMLLGGDKSMLLNLPIENIKDAITFGSTRFKTIGDGFLVEGYPMQNDG